jgi:hypothetical protein
MIIKIDILRKCGARGELLTKKKRIGGWMKVCW